MLSGLSLQTMALLLGAGVVLDCLLGEPRRWHPLVGFGRLAGLLERRLNKRRFALGVLAWSVAVLPLVAFAAAALHGLETTGYTAWVVAGHALLLYACLGLRSLREHVLPIQHALQAGDLAQARALTARIVSRDTSEADETDLAKAAAESTLENGNDAVFGTLFWFIVAGGPGALLFRLANTLDAMWGYRSERLQAFGCAAARIDDALNWIPARLTALSYALFGQTRTALACWRVQAPHWSSPNAGPVMAAGAGALGVALGGAARYDGVVEMRPPLGCGRDAVGDDIGRAWALVARSVGLWLLVIATLAIWKG